MSTTGFVQFDPDDDNPYSGRVNLGGHEAFKFTIRATGLREEGGGQPLVTVTLWPEWSDSFDKIKLGTFVAVDGEYSRFTKTGEAGKQKVYHNIRATGLSILPTEHKQNVEKAVVNPVNDSSDDDYPF